jgi:predicted DsbA family dithiol-disulfide isomerase
MNQMEVFIDISCPYCRQGFTYLSELLPLFPAAKLDWRFVEAHPRNEEPLHRPYVDLVVQGSLYFKRNGLNEQAYAERMFKALFDERLNIEDHRVLITCASEVGADSVRFAASLNSGEYIEAQFAQNDYAYEKQGVWAVPTFIGGAERLDAVPGVGVTKVQLEALMTKLFG